MSVYNANKGLGMKIIQNIFSFYSDGFKGMKVGKKLWLIIGIKFFLFFVILKLLYFPNFLNTHFSNDKDKADFVMENLTQTGH